MSNGSISVFGLQITDRDEPVMNIDFLIKNIDLLKNEPHSP
jgi:hypothetical protein